MTARGRIAKAKDYFYVIVPLEYAAAGAPPASWFVNDLMAAMTRPYYVGLLTAAQRTQLPIPFGRATFWSTMRLSPTLTTG